MIAFFTLNICANRSISVISSSQWNMSLQLVFFELFEEKWLLKRLIFADCTKIRIVFFKDRKDWSTFSKVSGTVSVDFTLETSLRGSCVRICIQRKITISFLSLSRILIHGRYIMFIFFFFALWSSCLFVFSFLYCFQNHLFVYWFSVQVTLRKKCFSSRIYSVNVIKFVVSCKFGQIYRRNR